MAIYKKINIDFFKKWTKEMSYVLGFFAADGCITVNKRGGQFWSINIIDKNLIEKIKSSVGSEHKIGLRKRGKHISYRLQVGSLEMCSDLRSHGYSERKTNTLMVPSVPERYFSHFVRGYFDGDGHVWFGRLNKKRKTDHYAIQTVFTSSSEDFLHALMINLAKAGIGTGSLNKGKGNYYRLAYSVASSLKLYDFMYNKVDSSYLLLERKKRVFEEYMKLRT